MPKRLAALLMLATVLAGVAAEAATPSAKNRPVSFRAQIAPIFERECAFCHTATDPHGALTLEPHVARAQLVGAASSESLLLRVEPGRPEKSYLYAKLTGEHRKVGGLGTKMPPGWQSLPATDLSLIKRWIREGAKDN